MRAWKRRLEELAKKEARCPACAKAARINADNQEPKVCEHHISVRHRMAFGTMRMG